MKSDIFRVSEDQLEMMLSTCFSFGMRLAVENELRPDYKSFEHVGRDFSKKLILELKDQFGPKNDKKDKNESKNIKCEN